MGYNGFTKIKGDRDYEILKNPRCYADADGIVRTGSVLWGNECYFHAPGKNRRDSGGR